MVIVIDLPPGVALLDMHGVQKDKETFLKGVQQYTAGHIHNHLQKKEREIFEMKQRHVEQVEAVRAELHDLARDAARKESLLQKHIRKLDLDNSKLSNEFMSHNVVGRIS